LKIKKINCSIKSIDNWYCFGIAYTILCFKKKNELIYFVYLFEIVQKKLTLLKGMLVKKYLIPLKIEKKNLIKITKNFNRGSINIRIWMSIDHLIFPKMLAC
jgi:hypothetical protein